VLSGVTALLIGAVSLRTSGVSFIMITLAFAQMLYYLGISINAWGADDGMRLARRSDFAGALDLANPYVFYYVVLGILSVLLWLGHRLIHARFGVVIRASRSNEPRMRAIGFSTFRYRLAAFALAGSVCGLAGALLTNQTEYLTPSFMHWTRSGEIMMMVILGGMGTLFGPVLGALALLLLEDVLSAWTVHWQVVLGPILVLVVLYARGGLWSLLPGGARRDG
jgi:branched-chain amino acid transport system permease protein